MYQNLVNNFMLELLIQYLNRIKILLKYFKGHVYYRVKISR
jgi:hypothetical protein